MTVAKTTASRAARLERLLLVAELLLAYLVQIEALTPTTHQRVLLPVHAAIDSTCEVAQSLEYLIDCCQREQTARGATAVSLFCYGYSKAV